ncbi:hypothetical protein TSOC_004567 [Tetrabaena socialis]|uniref:Uncharacterized protein n=1 Tax=Tetrabaena socialis TaxID=47790 RepID=A0A2J8A8N1_9CHLO|nr:hypothetical protein TSOC_004567 [Tetrabaena socialis]|eukprot:PNH08861.1 hypothetical protein TSOC_004567 [Tetrabaena socialis]
MSAPPPPLMRARSSSPTACLDPAAPAFQPTALPLPHSTGLASRTSSGAAPPQPQHGLGPAAGMGPAAGPPAAPQPEHRPPRPPPIIITREPASDHPYGVPAEAAAALHAAGYAPPGPASAPPTHMGAGAGRERRLSSASYSSNNNAPAGSVGEGGGGGGLDGLGGPSNLTHMLDFINHHKLTGNRPVYALPPGDPGVGGRLHGRPGGSQQLHERDPKWVQPSGPRRPGEGVENEEQGIVSAEKTPQGMILRITLLAAGFVIGGWVARAAAACATSCA